MTFLSLLPMQIIKISRWAWIYFRALVPFQCCVYNIRIMLGHYCRFKLLHQFSSSSKYLQDVFMDWSVFQRHARYRFLRNEVIYSNSISVCLQCTMLSISFGLTKYRQLYYVAIVRLPATSISVQTNHSMIPDLECATQIYMGALYPSKRARHDASNIHSCFTRGPSEVAVEFLYAIPFL